MNSREVYDIPSESGSEWSYVESGFRNTSGENGFLLFCHMDGLGNPVSPPGGGLSEQLWRRLRRASAYMGSQDLFQVQAWCVDRIKLDDSSRESILNLFLATREIMRQQMSVLNE